MRFLVVRHRRTDWNDLNKVQGITDNPLNETGEEQALRSKRIYFIR